MNTSSSANAALLQLLVFTLLVERIMATKQALFRKTQASLTEEPQWNRSDTLIAAAIAFVLLWIADFNFLSAVLGKETGQSWVADWAWKGLGYLVGALTAASGSAGLSKVMEAISLGAKASGEKSKATVHQATLEHDLRAQTVRRPNSLELSAIINTKAQQIIDCCEREWPANSDDCSSFVRDVASELSVALTGNADSIVDQIKGDGWTVLIGSPDRLIGQVAKEAADSGMFVIAGLKSVDTSPRENGQRSTHGHVVIVVAGPLEDGRYPTAYWGTYNGRGEKRKGINWAWRRADRDKVIYAARVV